MESELAQPSGEVRAKLNRPICKAVTTNTALNELRKFISNRDLQTKCLVSTMKTEGNNEKKELGKM